MTQFSSLYTGRLDRELGTDDASILFTTARRKAAVNEGIREFADLTECCVRWSTVTVSGGTAEYDLLSTTVITDGDFARLGKENVEFRYTDAGSNTLEISGDDLLRRDVLWLDRYQSGWRLSTVASSVSQLPSAYYTRADGSHLWLGFTPVPSTGSSASASFRFPYIAQPAVLTSDTSEPYTFNSSVRTDLRPFHQAAVHYAAYQLEKLRRDDQASDRQLQKFMGYVQKYASIMRVKGGRTLSAARTYFGKRAASV